MFGTEASFRPYHSVLALEVLTYLLTLNNNKPALSNTETDTRARRPFLADTQKVTLLGLLDMSAAFDTVDHKILLERLEVSFGVKGLALAWLSSFLVDRTQVVAFGGNKSTSRRLLYGVPQGSVLGPLLFALYSADVIRIAAKHGVCIHAYADDLQTYISCAASDQNTTTSRLLTVVS